MVPRLPRRGRNLNAVLQQRKARRQDRLRTILFGALAGGFMLFLFIQLERRSGQPDVELRRIVVMPFDNLTGDTAYDPVGLIAADWSTRVLGFYRASVDVVPTTTTLAHIAATRLDGRAPPEQIELLAEGVRAGRVVSGAYYIVGDSLHIAARVDDLLEPTASGPLPEVVTSMDGVMRGIDRMGKTVVFAIVPSAATRHPVRLEPPALAEYAEFVAGLRAFAQRTFAEAALHFALAASLDPAFSRARVWLLDALVRARRFQQADSVARTLDDVPLAVTDAERAYTANARLRQDLRGVHTGLLTLTQRSPADDLATFELALATLARWRPRAARTLFESMEPTRGALVDRPDFYLHHAATHHLTGSHRTELRVVRSGLRQHPRSVHVRLADCRARAALGNHERANQSIDELLAIADSGQAAAFARALADCASELEAHGMTAAGRRARSLAIAWDKRAARPPVARDSAYESAHILFDRSRDAARAGEPAKAIHLLFDAVRAGLPFYEPGRTMLHAEPAFHRLRDTRAFIRLNQPQG